MKLDQFEASHASKKKEILVLRHKCDSWDTDHAIICEKLHEMRMSIKRKTTELHNTQSEVTTLRNNLIEVSANKEDLKGQLAELNMQINAMPVLSDQTTYFQEKVNALTDEIDHITLHMTTSMELITNINKLLSTGEVDQTNALTGTVIPELFNMTSVVAIILQSIQFEQHTCGHHT